MHAEKARDRSEADLQISPGCFGRLCCCTDSGSCRLLSPQRRQRVGLDLTRFPMHPVWWRSSCKQCHGSLFPADSVLGECGPRDSLSWSKIAEACRTYSRLNAAENTLWLTVCAIKLWPKLVGRKFFPSHAYLLFLECCLKKCPAVLKQVQKDISARANQKQQCMKCLIQFCPEHFPIRQRCAFHICKMFGPRSFIQEFFGQ